MFNNIGKKIKTLAQVVCWTEIIGFVIIGTTLIEEGEDGGILIIILGAIFAWASSLMTYGFGEIIDLLILNFN